MSESIKHTFTATGISPESFVKGAMNITVRGLSAGDAVIELQRKFNTETVWETTNTFTANASVRSNEPEEKVKYRFNCPSYAAGTIDVRIGV